MQSPVCRSACLATRRRFLTTHPLPRDPHSGTRDATCLFVKRQTTSGGATVPGSGLGALRAESADAGATWASGQYLYSNPALGAFARSMWVTLEASRNVRITGADNDDNGGLELYIREFKETR